MKHTGIKIFAPATIGNLIVGFDIMGMALDKPGDEVIARFSDTPGLRIKQVYGAKGGVSKEVGRNAAGVAAQRFLEHIGASDRGIELEIHKKIRFSSGLGSGAASAVAGVLAVNELLKRPLQKRELLPFALAGEQLVGGAPHCARVASSLLGGIMFIRNNEEMDVHRIPAPRGVYVTVICPEIKMDTATARRALPHTITLQQHTLQSANIGGLIIGLYNSDFDLISRSLQDHIIESQCTRIIPGFMEVQKAALEQGVLGCSVSGMGSAIVALSSNSLIAENASEAMQRIFKDLGVKSKAFISTINSEGAYKF